MTDTASVTRTVPALSAGGPAEGFNRIAPALSRDTVGDINRVRQTGFPDSGGVGYIPPRDAGNARARPAASGGESRLPRDAGTARPASSGGEGWLPREIEAPEGWVDARTPARAPARPSVQPSVQPPAPARPRPLAMPKLLRPAQRGQKTRLDVLQGSGARLRVGFGWNVKDARCDIDASAFLLGADNRVPSDDWFVFYGQTVSPDGSLRLQEDGRTDRQVISIDFGRLDPRIERIVFVMTINEAVERRLNFGMIEEAWLRVLDEGGRERVSFRPDELYENITSMTLGEIYLRSGEWRFNPVGNGVNTDLAGQCAIYGVEIS